VFLGDTGRMKGQHPGSADSKRRALVIRSVILILLGLGALTLVPYCLLLLLLPSWRGVEEANQKPGTVLLVTAHPDDETVFFAPTITALHSLGHEVFLLCLTTGNARGIGHIRSKELENAASALRIDKEHLKIENDDRRLPDSKSIDWDMPHAIRLIEAAVARWGIDNIITFDRGGVTGHKNHMSCWQAVRTYIGQCVERSCPSAWSLLSSGKWRRYSSLVDPAPWGSHQQASQTASFVNRSLFSTLWAMHHHKTQWRWWSHVLFTRYTYYNSLRAILPEPPSRRLMLRFY